MNKYDIGKILEQYQFSKLITNPLANIPVIKSPLSKELYKPSPAIAEIDKLSSAMREINNVGATLREINKVGATLREINKVGSAMREINKVGATIREINNIGSTIRDLLTALADLPEKQKAIVLNMSDKGWFPFEMCLIRISKAVIDIDAFMIKRIDEYYEELKQLVLERNPSRLHILKVVFDLFEKKNFIACIPLMLTQIDGICQDSHKTFYFTKKERPGKKFPTIIQEKMIEVENKEIYEILKAIVDKANDNFISDSFSSVKDVDSINILNRGAILHGHNNFLEYGSELNAYKVLSLLLYVNWMIELFTGYED